MTAKDSPMTWDDFLNMAAEIGCDGVELTSYYFPPNVDVGYINRVKRRSFLLGLDVSGTSVGNRFTVPPGEERNAQLAAVKNWINRAAEMGAPCMRVFAGGAPKGTTEEQAMKWVVECLEECAPLAEQRGVILALENHGGVTATAANTVSMVKAIKSDWVGINLDTGNFGTDDPYADIAVAAPFAVTTHVKTAVRPKGKQAEALDLKRISSILGQIGYRGYLTLEYEASEDPKTGVPRFIRQLKDIIG
jgi:sugar phosphate isomerase/epimerase